ncbi:hypothetical protein GJQ54_03010 [Oceanospirillaceae bacterium ASx5O]|nr:hypothetical protein GJQ54_03010 [Oceanospirillaceae bacterium ASx5O]
MNRIHWLEIIFCSLLLSACGGGGGSITNIDTPTESGTAENTELHQVLKAMAEQLPVAAVSLPYQNPGISVPAGAVFSAQNLPAWAAINTNTGVISGTPDQTHPGHRITLRLEKDHQHAEVNINLPVVPAEQFDELSARDYYAEKFGGGKRSLRNDLTGELSGEVLFLQSHSVRPTGNFNPDSGDETRSIYSPRLVALRDALLLFIPATDTTPVTLDVQYRHHGGEWNTLPMQPPSALPKADYQGPEQVAFSTRAWNVPLPWEVIRNGLELRFITDSGSEREQEGLLPAADIDIGPASQIVFQSIRLGMLTHFDKTSGHFTLNNPVLAASDYFQTIPVSRLVMASYADMRLDRVMVRSGAIYDSVSATDGGIYGGDMRGDVAKSQVSIGINMANFGITSHHMNQNYTHLFKQITNHHAWGNYQNGRQQHGLSGGNGMGTLTSSSGNEASHEWGHAYGLGHYPGAGLTEDGRFQRHYADSGWGYIAHRSRLRDNLTDGWASELQPKTFHFMGRIGHGWDAMSGGSPNTPLSAYTHHTAYSARVIQNDIGQFPLPDSTYTSGYKIWDETLGEYRNFAAPANQVRPVPTAVGVPVATLLGAYNPDTDEAVIYPVFHGNYGNIFNFPAPDMTSNNDMCWLDVRNNSNEQRLIQVAASRHVASSVNQLHMNLPAEFRPTSATLNCRRGGVQTELTRTEFDGLIPELPPVAIVGQDAGFRQLRERELAELSTIFAQQSTADFPVLTSQQLTLLNSYVHDERLQYLSSAALPVYGRWYQQQQQARLLSRLVNKFQADLLPETVQNELLNTTLTHIAESGSDISLPTTGSAIYGERRFAGQNSDNQLLLTNSVAEERQWFMTANGRIQPADEPWLCLSPASGRLTLLLCDNNNSSQYWQHTELRQIKNQSTGQCIDYAFNNGTLVMYGCHGNNNQKWNVPAANNSLLLNLLPGNTIRQLVNMLNREVAQ